MLRMVDRHAVQEMLSAGLSAGEVARHFGISSRTVRRIRSETRVGTADDTAARHKRQVGRPGVASQVPERMRALMEADPKAPRQEVLRRLREEGVKVGQGTFWRNGELHDVHVGVSTAWAVELLEPSQRP